MNERIHEDEEKSCWKLLASLSVIMQEEARQGVVTANHFLFACAFPVGAADLPAIAACIWSKFFGLRNRRTWGSGATTSKEQLRLQRLSGNASRAYRGPRNAPSPDFE